VAIQEDLPEGWTLSSTLNLIGLGAIAPGAKNAPPVIDPEIAKEMFTKLYVAKTVGWPQLIVMQTWERSRCSTSNLRLCACK